MHFDFAQCKQKGTASLFVLLIVLVLLGGIGGYIYFNKPLISPLLQIPQITNQIQNSTKTYQNTNLNFEFKYSSKGLKVLEDSEEAFNKRGNGDFRKNYKGYVGYEPAKVLGAVVVLDEKNSYDTNPLTVWVFDNANNLTIDGWYKNYWYYPFVWGDFTYTGKFTLAPKEEATISGQIGKSGVIDYQPGKPKFIYLSKNGKMYLFRIIADGEKILSTFKFL